jgi:hypothetical protein
VDVDVESVRLSDVEVLQGNVDDVRRLGLDRVDAVARLFVTGAAVHAEVDLTVVATIWKP